MSELLIKYEDVPDGAAASTVATCSDLQTFASPTKMLDTANEAPRTATFEDDYWTLGEKMRLLPSDPASQSYGIFSKQQSCADMTFETPIKLELELYAEAAANLCCKVDIKADDVAVRVAIAHRREGLVKSENKLALIEDVLQRCVALLLVQLTGIFGVAEHNVGAEPLLCDLACLAVRCHLCEDIGDLLCESVVAAAEADCVVLGAEVLGENGVLLGGFIIRAARCGRLCRVVCLTSCGERCAEHCCRKCGGEYLSCLHNIKSFLLPCPIRASAEMLSFLTVSL